MSTITAQEFAALLAVADRLGVAPPLAGESTEVFAVRVSAAVARSEATKEAARDAIIALRIVVSAGLAFFGIVGL